MYLDFLAHPSLHQQVANASQRPGDVCAARIDDHHIHVTGRQVQACRQQFLLSYSPATGF